MSQGDESSSSPELADDPRWQLIERILRSEPFRKSSRLPALLRYLGRCTIAGDLGSLTEQMIGRAVFHKTKDYNPAEDSSVRVYIRQLRLRLHEYYQVENQKESLLLTLPKGGYLLTFTPVVLGTPAVKADSTLLAQPRKVEDGPLPPTPLVTWTSLPKLYLYAFVVLFTLAITCAVGWYQSALSRHTEPPWPLNQVMGKDVQTTVVLADASYSLRLLGSSPIPLDRYIDRTYSKPLMPAQMSDGERRLLHYLEISRITSMADAHAAAALSAFASASAANLTIRSAKNLSSSDLTQGNFIFVGAKSSNPWVELFDGSLNYQLVEGSPSEGRYIVNRKPRDGEQARYTVAGSTGSSGEDYATITLLSTGNGRGNVLLVQGLRMEGTEAAIDLLKTTSLRDQLKHALTRANQGSLPTHFEVLLHAQSVSGAPVSVNLVSVR